MSDPQRSQRNIRLIISFVSCRDSGGVIKLTPFIFTDKKCGHGQNKATKTHWQPVNMAIKRPKVAIGFIVAGVLMVLFGTIMCFVVPLVIDDQIVKVRNVLTRIVSMFYTCACMCWVKQDSPLIVPEDLSTSKSLQSQPVNDNRRVQIS